MKFYCVTALRTVSESCLVHTRVCTPIYGLPPSQSDLDLRILSVFQSVYNNETCNKSLKYDNDCDVMSIVHSFNMYVLPGVEHIKFKMK